MAGEATKALPPPRSRPPPGSEGRGRGGGGRGVGRGGARGRYERQVQQENEKRMAHHNALVQIYTPKPIRSFFYTDDRIRYSLAATHQLNSDKGTRHTAFHPSHISYASVSRPFLSLNESGPLDLYKILEVGGKTALCKSLYCVLNLSDTLGILNFCLQSQRETENEDPLPLPFSPSSFSPAPIPRKEREGAGEGENKEKERKEKGKKKEIEQVLETCNGKSFLSQQIFRFMPTWHDLDSEFESGILASSYSQSTPSEPQPPSSLHLPPRSPSSSSRLPPSSSILLSSLNPLDSEEKEKGEAKEKTKRENEDGKNENTEQDKEKAGEEEEEEVGVYCQHPYPPQFQLLVSFPHGDVIRYDLVSRQLTARYNKSGAIHSAEATDVRWVPGTKCTQFVVCFNDGILLHYNLTATIQPEKKGEGATSRRRGAGAKSSGEKGWSSSLSSLWNSVTLTEEKKVEETPATRARSYVVKDPTDIFVSKEKMRDVDGNAEVSIWKVSNKPISRAAFSPPNPSSPLRFALVDREGYVKVFDWESSTLLFCLKSHFGCFLALEWSPCARLLALGGEDDAVSVLDIDRRKIVCRGEGHRSWVSFLSFLNETDENEEKEKTKRGGSLSFSLASVGQDGYLCLWKGSLDDEGRPRSRTVSGLVKRERAGSTKAVKQESNVGSRLITYPKSVPEIKPVAMHRSHNNPLSSVVYLPEGIVTACTSGILKLWKCDNPTQ